MTPLAGQKILLIGIGFYDYEAAIAAEFRALGAQVRVEDERPPEMRGQIAGLYRQLKWDMTAACARHQTAILQRVRADGVPDHVVVIKGTLLDESFLTALRDAMPHAQFTAYHWDSMARFPELIQRQSLFDRVLTFDHVDAATNPKLILRPLFFRPELARASVAQSMEVNICFVGWLHHKRLAQVEAIREQVSELGMLGSYYLSTGPVTRMKLLVSRRGQDVHAKQMPFSTYSETVASANVILDLPHPEQTGLTMRAIEAIGAGKKLLTTARDVVKYDFFCSENVSVINDEYPHLDRDFLQKPGVEISSEIVDRYSLRSWALDVCGITNPPVFFGTTGSSYVP